MVAIRLDAVARQGHLLLEVGHHVGEHQVVAAGVDRHDAQHSHDAAPVVLEDLCDRGFRDLSVCLQGQELRRLVELGADVPTDQAQRAGHQERDTPPPLGHRVLADDREHRGDEQRGDEEAGGGADRHHADVARPLLRWGEFADEHCGAGVFAGCAEALQQAGDQQQQGGRPADRIVGRQQADQGGDATHSQDRDGQHLLAAELVAVVAPEHPTERIHQEGHPEDREGLQDGQRRVVGGEEDRGQRDRHERVDGVAEVLHEGADTGSGHDVAGRALIGWCDRSGGAGGHPKGPSVRVAGVLTAL